MNTHLSRRLLTALGLVLTIAALAAPSANAKIVRVYSDRGVTTASTSPELNPNMVYSDRGMVPTYPDGTPVTIYSDHGIATIPPAQGEPIQVAKVSTDNPSSFDWSKTGYIVSLSIVGLLLLGGGVLLAGRHNRRQRLAAA